MKRADIEEIKPSEVSLMPIGLLNSLTEEEIEDLVAFLLARGDSRDKTVPALGLDAGSPGLSLSRPSRSCHSRLVRRQGD